MTPSSADSRVVLYGRPGCHLCDDARAVVAEVCDADGVQWEERSIDADDDLLRRFGEKIPVVVVDGDEVAHWRIDPSTLRRALSP